MVRTFQLNVSQERVWRLTQEKRTTREIATALGVSPQRVHAIRLELTNIGVIRRIGDIPKKANASGAYPWVQATDVDVHQRQPDLPRLRLRLAYATDSQRDLTVPPIWHVRWGRWSVQGVPCLDLACNPDRAPRVPAHRAVVVAELGPDGEPENALAFLASTQHPWSESDTFDHVEAGDEIPGLTMVIACAVRVEAVLDGPYEEADE